MSFESRTVDDGGRLSRMPNRPCEKKGAIASACSRARRRLQANPNIYGKSLRCCGFMPQSDNIFLNKPMPKVRARRGTTVARRSG